MSVTIGFLIAIFYLGLNICIAIETVEYNDSERFVIFLILFGLPFCIIQASFCCLYDLYDMIDIKQINNSEFTLTPHEIRKLLPQNQVKLGDTVEVIYTHRDNHDLNLGDRFVVEAINTECILNTYISGRVNKDGRFDTINAKYVKVVKSRPKSHLPDFL